MSPYSIKNLLCVINVYAIPVINPDRQPIKKPSIVLLGPNMGFPSMNFLPLSNGLGLLITLPINITIENTGDDTTTYTINPASYSTWASSADIDSNTFTLDKGKSKEVLITFNVKKDVSGEKTFSIELLSENQLVTTQPVSVAIEDSSFFSKLSGESNAWLWGIGFLNIVLVVIIILVAVRIVKK